MPAFLPVTLNDGAATPVAHTFGPGPLVGTQARYEDRSGGISIGYPTLTVLVTPPSKTSTVRKVRMKVVMPVMETLGTATWNGIDPAPTKAYEMTFVGEFFLPERCTLQQRKDIKAYAKNLLANALATDLVETQEAIY